MVAARRRGLSFEAFWEEAVRPGLPLVMVTHPDPPAGAVQWPTDRNDRVTWQAAINGSKAGWQRSFERRPPTPQEAALLLLAPALGALDVVADERARDELREKYAEAVAPGALPSAA